MKADPNNSLFQHEFGHYLQSLKFGLTYIPKIGIPSIISANGENHDYHSVEQDANARALRYFVKRHGQDFATSKTDDEGWDFSENPIRSYRQGESFYSEHNQSAINNVLLKFSSYDYLPHSYIPVFNLGMGFLYDTGYNKIKY